MDGFKAYKYYIAVKLHFTTNSFDVFVNPNVKGSRDVFESRNDRRIFENLARRFDKDFDLIQFYVANFAYGHDATVYSLGESDRNLTLWQKRKQSITQVFQADCNTIILHMEKTKLKSVDLFEAKIPELLKLFLGGHISIESMCILEKLYGYLDSWKANTNLLWEQEYRRICKCGAFVKYDPTKIDLINSNFKSELEELQNG
jgi:hypothetical protein